MNRSGALHHPTPTPNLTSPPPLHPSASHPAHAAEGPASGARSRFVEFFWFRGLCGFLAWPRGCLASRVVEPHGTKQGKVVAWPQGLLRPWRKDCRRHHPDVGHDTDNSKSVAKPEGHIANFVSPKMLLWAARPYVARPGDIYETGGRVAFVLHLL